MLLASNHNVQSIQVTQANQLMIYYADYGQIDTMLSLISIDMYTLIMNHLNDLLQLHFWS